MTEKEIKIAVGVEKRTVEIGSATVTIDEEKTSLEGVVEAIEDAGFTVLSS